MPRDPKKRADERIRRVQPYRKTKEIRETAKKRADERIRRVQPYRKVKQMCERDSSKFDPISVFLWSCGLAGENLTREIFSYIDFSSLQEARLVCKLWNQFLVSDRLLSLRMLKKTKPYLENMFEYISYNQSIFNETSVALYKESVKGYYECIKNQENFENWTYGKIYKICRKIISTIAAFHLLCCRDWSGYGNAFFFNNGQLDYSLWEFIYRFINDLVGEKLSTEFEEDFRKGKSTFYFRLSARVAEIEGRQIKINDVKASTGWIVRYHTINGPRALEIQRGIQPIITWEEHKIRGLLKSILKGMKKELCTDVQKFQF